MAGAEAEGGIVGTDSKIEWCTHTFNPWIGCTAVSPACDHCYAERFGARLGVKWGNHPRRRTASSGWKNPLRWNDAAARAGRRDRVFCASLADVFDNQVDPEWRTDLWTLIASTPHLDWLLLTKRPQNIAKMLPGSYVEQLMGQDLPWPWPNVWLGTTVENQEEADRRITHLVRVPAAVHFLSCEPLLGPINISRHLVGREINRSDWTAGVGWRVGARIGWIPPIAWVICGGESGHKARMMKPAWARSLRDQCASAGVAFFFKQWGEWSAPGYSFPDGRPDLIEDDDDARFKVGKKAAGRLLDGVEHNDFPEAV
jgi:protein gp37